MLRIRRRRPQPRGFTLMELLIVIAILLALVGIVAGVYIGVQDRAEKNIQTVQISMIVDALDRFRVDMRRYPTEEEGIAVLWNKNLLMDEADLDKWQGPYLTEPVNADPWGTALIYYSPSQLMPDSANYDLISAGPDKEEGTEDDITNHDSRRGADGEFAEDDFTIGGGSGGGSGTGGGL